MILVLDRFREYGYRRYGTKEPCAAVANERIAVKNERLLHRLRWRRRWRNGVSVVCSRRRVDSHFYKTSAPPLPDHRSSTPRPPIRSAPQQRPRRCTAIRSLSPRTLIVIIAVVVVAAAATAVHPSGHPATADRSLAATPIDNRRLLPPPLPPTDHLRAYPSSPLPRAWLARFPVFFFSRSLVVVVFFFFPLLSLSRPRLRLRRPRRRGRGSCSSCYCFCFRRDRVRFFSFPLKNQRPNSSQPWHFDVVVVVVVVETTAVVSPRPSIRSRVSIFALSRRRVARPPPALSERLFVLVHGRRLVRPLCRRTLPDNSPTGLPATFLRAFVDRSPWTAQNEVRPYVLVSTYPLYCVNPRPTLRPETLDPTRAVSWA